MLRKLGTILIVATVCAIAQAQTSIKSGMNLFSAEDDANIGKQSAIEAEKQLPMLSDATVVAYVDRIGQRLARNAGGPQFQYRFHVVNQTEINAFALPGGYVYINRGILENARNEGEVAGVVAHEIAHASLRHGTQQASKAYLAEAGANILGALLGGNIGKNTADIVNTVGGAGLNVLFLKYSRDFESQADIRGAQILAASGYAPADMVSFFRTLERVDPSKKTTWLSNHPAPPDRIARIEKEAQMLQVTRTPTQNVAELRRVQARLTAHGIASALPGQVTTPAAGAYETYTNRSGFYRLSVPTGWDAYDSGSKGVTIVAPGSASNVTVNHYEPFDNEAIGEVTLQAATQDLISTIRKNSPYLKLANKRAQTLRMSGGPALAATLRGTDPNTRTTRRVTLVTTQLPDEHLLYLMFITPENEAGNYSRVLNTMIASLQIDPNREP